MRVLTVEDNPATRNFIRSTLECEGHDVAEAATGVEGLQLARRFRPDVVLVDLLLPDMGGLELAERIRSQAGPRTVAIIGFTGALPEDEAAALRSGVLDDLLIKPADSRDLADAVARYLPRPHGPPGRGRPALSVGRDDGAGIKPRLEALGFTVASVASGEEALAAARETIPSVVVTEMSTSGLSGFELCVALRRDPTLSKVPVVLVSAFGIDDDDRRAARRVGANSLLSHPADLRALEVAIGDAMSSAPPPVTVTDPRTEYVAYLQRCLSRHSAWSAHVASMGSMRAAQLELIEHLADALAGSEDLDLALSTLVAELVHVLGASRGVVYITDFGGRPVPRAQLGYAPIGGGGG